MSKERKSALNELLNQLEAMLDARIVKASDIASAVLPEQNQTQAATRVSEWLRARSRKPNGETALRMLEFSSGQLLRITEDSKLRNGFRRALKAVEGKRKEIQDGAQE